MFLINCLGNDIGGWCLCYFPQLNPHNLMLFQNVYSIFYKYSDRIWNKKKPKRSFAKNQTDTTLHTTKDDETKTIIQLFKKFVASKRQQHPTTAPPLSLNHLIEIYLYNVFVVVFITKTYFLCWYRINPLELPLRLYIIYFHWNSKLKNI